MQTYGKDRKVHKALNKELEELPAISSIHRINSVHDFYNKLSRDEEINFCAKFDLHSDGQASQKCSFRKMTIGRNGA